VLERLKTGEAVALATRLEASGSVSIGGIPIAGVYVQKSFGMRPLLVFEGGAILSELAKSRAIVGGKLFLYGQDMLQAQITAGFDVTGKKGVGELQAFSKAWKGYKLGIDVRYQINLSGDQEFRALAFIGGEFELGGSKGRGEK
jgi:hypothetical protein